MTPCIILARLISGRRSASVNKLKAQRRESIYKMKVLKREKDKRWWIVVDKGWEVRERACFFTFRANSISKTSLVNCNCTCGPGNESRNGSPTSSGKLRLVLRAFGAPFVLVAALIYVAGNRGLISSRVLRTGPLVPLPRFIGSSCTCSDFRFPYRVGGGGGSVLVVWFAGQRNFNFENHFSLVLCESL